ncbi:hypothetical protein ECG_07237 [Echinococcus granulosus]|uniref:Expressed conserved protein n=1 Tax=Echinococcus granulosus TaxID=6210 RepID=U6JF02_ECHGR|nr:hypothetical protein EGR_05472 [Echinococcus granulosus]EUB59710.1 hypothetical protein EGR_05472 [Echinococcus granulosus]KAH9280741.1 hypothetical protein ECG_07237 [Echinococcus granulosus]CDS21902.1 expressed conserved protein [Echinococcus granulosus]
MSPRGCLLLLMLVVILGISIQWTEAQGHRSDGQAEEFAVAKEMEEEDDDDEGEDYDDDDEEEEKEVVANRESKLLKHCLNLQNALKEKMESVVNQMKDCSKILALA